MRLFRLVVVLLWAGTAQAQTPVFDVLSRANGLPSDYVFGLAQDANGFLWLATDAGVARYDGRAVRTWTTADGLPSNLVYAVHATPDGAMWAGTYEGAARRTQGRFETVLSGEAIHHVQTDAYGRVYLIGARLHVWERGRMRLLHSAVGGSLNAPPLWPSTFALTLPSGQILNVHAFPDTVVAQMVSTSPDTLASRMGTSPWAMAYRHGVLSVRRATRPAPLASLRTSRPLLTAPFRQDWLVSTLHDGVLRWDGVALTPFLTADQINRQSAYAALQDYEGSLWLGLFGGGAWRLSGLHRTLPGRTDERLAAPFVHLSRDRAGLHAATRSHVYTLDNRLRILRTYPATQVGRIAHARDGTAFVVSSTFLRDAAGRNLLAESNWFSSARFDNGDTLWLGTYGGGVRRLVNGRELPKRSLPHNVLVVEDLVLGTGGAMWALTRSHGAMRYRSGWWTAFGRREGLPSDAVFSLFDTPDGTVWLGTDLGLVRVRHHGTPQREVRVFDDRRRLRGQRVHAVAAIADTVWAIGDHTAYAVVGDSMRAFDAAPLLPAPNLVVHDAEIVSETRQAVLATSGGLVSVDLTRLDVTLPPPRVALVQVDGRDVDAAPDTLRLAAGARGVALAFAPLTFASPASAHLQTRADNGPWSAPTLDRTVSLAALTDGWHRLDVRAVNVAGTSSATPLVLHLYVPPPWWRTVWARGLGLILLVGVAVATTRAVIHLRRRRAEEKRTQQQRVQDERERIARELHDHVGAQLAGVLAGLQLVDPAEPSGLVPALRDEVRQTIAALRTTLWTLKHPPRTAADLGHHLARYVRDQARLHPSVTLAAETGGLTDRGLPPLGTLHLFRVAQEALSNALRHANARRIVVALGESDDGTLTLSVHDDGRFRPADGSGQGLLSMHARASEIGATFRLVPSDEGTAVVLVWKPDVSSERTMREQPASA